MKNKKIAGIICEYNPFHTGHLYQIQKLHEMGYEKIVCVMSSNSVQRGDFAIADKYLRAKTAVISGADLVLELPFPYCSASAEYFALAGLRILDNINADAICFGSESANEEILQNAADVFESDEFKEEYKALSNKGMGSAKAYFDAYKKITGNELKLKSNDLLAVSYLRAIKRENINITPLIIKRKGSDYNDCKLDNMETYPSACMLRNCIKNDGFTQISESMMPKNIKEIFEKAVNEGEAFADISNISSAILAFLRLSDEKNISLCAENAGGVCENICNNAKLASTYDELISLCTSKTYTESRIKRAILFALTGTLKSDLEQYPAYSIVLGLNAKGRKILSSVRKSSKIAFITKPADSVNLGEQALRQRKLSDNIDALFTLALPKPKENYKYVRKAPFVME